MKYDESWKAPSHGGWLKGAGRKSGKKCSKAGEGVRTLDIDVGNVTLYQLSYARTGLHKGSTSAEIVKICVPPHVAAIDIRDDDPYRK